MDTTTRKILVPFDFTNLSVNAVKQAVILAKIVDAEIFLLHVIEDISYEAEFDKKLREVAEDYSKKYNINFQVKIRVGVIHKVIKIYAVTIEAFLVIMKTQAPRGKEKYLRSRSIRVLRGAKIPFIVVQQAPQKLGFRNIVFPIDFRLENKEKLVWVSTLSKYYTSKIHFFKPNAKDYHIKSNLSFSKRFLEGKNIDYEIITGKRKLSNALETIEYAHTIGADLIIIMLSKSIGRLSSIIGLNEQQYISNKYKIPIMVINPRIDLHKYEGFS